MSVISECDLPDPLRRVIEEFRRHPNVDLLDTPEYACGSCQLASSDFCDLAQERGLETKLWYLQEIGSEYTAHCVAQIEEFFVDWTARQYEVWEEVDLPRIVTDLEDITEEIEFQVKEPQCPFPDWTIDFDREWAPVHGFRKNDPAVEENKIITIPLRGEPL